VLIAIALGVALLIKAFVVQAFFIQMESMLPTLEPAERVLVSKWSYRFGDPERGDVVILHDPNDPCRDDSAECDRSTVQQVGDWLKELFGLPLSESKDLVKRIIALPGETLEMRGGKTFINGTEVAIPSDSNGGPQADDTDLDPITIPEDEYYVMGDNRAASADSRSFGPVERRDLVGRAFVVVWPPGDWRGL
jgi:signal peptidase I